jgi:sugar phosphate isomerase/epimerase
MWSQYFYGSSPEDCVKDFSRKGWYFLELSSEHGELLLSRGNVEKTGHAFSCYAKNYGVSFPQGHLWLAADIAAVKQNETLDTLKRWLDLYCAADIHACVLHCGGSEMAALGKPDSEIREANINALRILCGHIKGSDSVICLENLAKFTTTATELKNLINAVGSDRLAICLDTGHLNMCGLAQAEFIEQAGGLLKALHITDNEDKSDQHIMPYGRGNIDWDGFISALAKSPYDGLLNFEIPGETYNIPYEILFAKLDYIREIALYMINKINAMTEQQEKYQ